MLSFSATSHSEKSHYSSARKWVFGGICLSWIYSWILFKLRVICDVIHLYGLFLFSSVKIFSQCYQPTFRTQHSTGGPRLGRSEHTHRTSTLCPLVEEVNYEVKWRTFALKYENGINVLHQHLWSKAALLNDVGVLSISCSGGGVSVSTVSAYLELHSSSSSSCCSLELAITQTKRSY